MAISRKALALLLALLIGAAFFLGGCTPSAPLDTSPAQSEEPAAERISTVGYYFDTVVTITLYGAEQAFLDQILEKCAGYEALLSKTVEGSDVWKINHAEGQPVQVGDDTRTVLETALMMGKATDGLFDISVAPVVELWHFTDGSAELPDEAALAAALEKVDYSQIQLEGNTVTLPNGWGIDLGAIAKGYIADQIAAFCKEQGVEAGILNFGGNVVTVGAKPGGGLWTVGIQDPKEQTGNYSMAVQVPERSVVTSGIYERGFELDGVRYHHILEPSTGWPVQNDLASTTVLSESSMLGDALSTACLLLGYEGSLELLKDFPGAEVIFITRDGETLCTKGAEDALIQQ